jgi:hypothetical protein
MTEVPTLADAARDLLDALDEERQLGVCAAATSETHEAEQRLRAALGQREPDTPAEDERAAWERMDRIIDGANPTRAAPATSEGGELDDLLRELDHMVEKSGAMRMTIHVDDVQRLARLSASALRSQQRDCVRIDDAAAHLSDMVDRLERDLAEARGTADAMADRAAQLMNERDGLRRELAEVRDTPRLTEHHPPGTEVAVVRVDSLPTREQIHAVVSDNLLDRRWAERCTDQLMALFGQTEGDRP